MRPTLRFPLTGKDGRSMRIFGLAPGGVYPAPPVSLADGALLPHLFTIAGPRGLRLCVFCGTFRGLGIWPQTPGLWPLNGFGPAPCPVEFGSSSPVRLRRIKATLRPRSKLGGAVPLITAIKERLQRWGRAGGNERNIRLPKLLFYPCNRSAIAVISSFKTTSAGKAPAGVLWPGFWPVTGPALWLFQKKCGADCFWRYPGYC